MQAFLAIVEEITRRGAEAEGATVQSATVYPGDHIQPPLFAAHLILDGCEYVLTLVPTKLRET